MLAFMVYINNNSELLIQYVGINLLTTHKCIKQYERFLILPTLCMPGSNLITTVIHC